MGYRSSRTHQVNSEPLLILLAVPCMYGCSERTLSPRGLMGIMLRMSLMWIAEPPVSVIYSARFGFKSPSNEILNVFLTFPAPVNQLLVIYPLK